MSNFEDSNSMGSIAIIGMGGRFPGARNMEEFWHNLYNGVESVKFFNREELVKMGIDEHLLDNPRFVAADAILDGMDEFDASFFDYSAREAEVMDPQHRLFLETAWEVMESAGYNSELYDGRVAVYAGANLSGYMIRNLYSNPGLVENVGSFKIMIANGQDFLATKVSYKMDFMGPSVNVNTLCSSSLVAVHHACQSLLSYGCDVAMAGGVSFQVSRNEAFFYQEGGIGSSDGHCRAYDSKANGTVSGSGLAIVVLKRLEDAIADGDYIHAVIRGTGINNDGSSKNSFTAPNVDGQAECIAEAIAMSGVNPETITYIDGHGTGTDLGDPIEISALTKAFRSYTNKKQYCAIGSVKTNIGHLVNAGGLVSVVKTVLAMENRVIPPSLNFEEPNPKIDFVNSPFYVNTKLSKWETDGFPLRAGVSSFGIGGTNTHIILEEAPEYKASEASKRPWQLISLSAKTGTALEKMTGNLHEHITKNPDISIADTAFTLHVGRRNMNHRRIIVCKDLQDLREKLTELPEESVFSSFQKPKDQPVVFMFSADKAYLNIGRELYQSEKVFSKIIDELSEILQSMIGVDVRNLLVSGDAGKLRNGIDLEEYSVGRAASFTVGYSIATLLINWGLEPQYLIGDGIGEYIAACVSGVISVEDALRMVIAKDDAFQAAVSKVRFNKVKIPFISCVSGEWISDSDAVNPEYWIRQRRGVNFKEGLKEVLKDPDQIFIEIGPGNRLFNEINRFAEGAKVINTLPDAASDLSPAEMMVKCIGKFWLAGGKINWNKFYSAEKRHRIPLPTYPFERERYWIEPGKKSKNAYQPEYTVSSKDEITEEIVDSPFTEGIITLKLNLKNKIEDGDKRKKQLEEILLLKQRLEELGKEYSSICDGIEVSGLGLRTDEDADATRIGSNSKLKKRPRPSLETPYEAPANEIQKVIAEKWQEVLGFDAIGINDDFFELGGHSLIAAAVATELGKRFDVQIPMRTLFETTTVAGIADLIETYKWAAESSSQLDDSEDVEGGTI